MMTTPSVVHCPVPPPPQRFPVDPGLDSRACLILSECPEWVQALFAQHLLLPGECPSQSNTAGRQGAALPVDQAVAAAWCPLPARNSDLLETTAVSQSCPRCPRASKSCLSGIVVVVISSCQVACRHHPSASTCKLASPWYKATAVNLGQHRSKACASMACLDTSSSSLDTSSCDRFCSSTSLVCTPSCESGAGMLSEYGAPDLRGTPVAARAALPSPAAKPRTRS
jgi:hypothetical protein